MKIAYEKNEEAGGSSSGSPGGGSPKTPRATYFITIIPSLSLLYSWLWITQLTNKRFDFALDKFIICLMQLLHSQYTTLMTFITNTPSKGEITVEFVQYV